MTNFNCNGLPVRFGFLLLNRFTLLSLSSAVEPLRMANRICQQEHYSWKTIAENGVSVVASDGIVVNVDCDCSAKGVLADIDILIVCGGDHVDKEVSDEILKWLRMVARKGISLGAVCTGSYVLAKAGLLDDYRCSIHWENMAVLSELFPNVAVSRSLYAIDRDRFTSSGGTSPVDMMLYIISIQCGGDVSSSIADQFIHERIRSSQDQQRVPLRHILGKSPEKLTIAVEIMEANIKDEISQEDLAHYSGLSRRQLQRLFQQYLGCTPTRYYQQLRLQRARELLKQTNKSLIEISQLTGFVSTSHFSKSYRKYFGHSPSMERYN
ncbi:MAG TPA: GlxA family transcriptional regulator [Pseudomonadales bacterium]|nr:AraC family transcriptional regulator [Gammaproteobacteria bacterium]MDP6026960.1 GlxA family transcriptional regulator [Pseudomonadales bacterium]MDP6315744.1 GlxA family transcriptional regulator [Pseudomonadales bacterium]MDP7315742.1 GlxA family transcriptional regulator [Pseudomonadales bacterium]HJP51415.1 GlxA family transcriptional regulator [Pseudomonadales bacterium]